MGYHKNLSDKYDHALRRMWDLFLFGKEREEELEKAVELARDELKRIRVLCNKANSECNSSYSLQIISEIDGLCERGLLDSNL